MVVRAFSLALAAVLAASSGAVARNAEWHPLSFTPHGHATTPVTINGAGPFDFIVDTAASAAAVTTAVTSRLGLIPEPGGQARVQGGGGVETADFYVLGSLVVAGVEARQRPAAVLDRVHKDYSAFGVIGADVLARGVLHLDLPEGRITFAGSGEIGNAGGPGWVTVPIKLNEHEFALVPIEIERKRMTAVLDTGARRSIVNWRAARKLGLSPGSPRLVPAQDVEGATEQATAAHQVEVTSIRAGLEWTSRTLTIADLSVFAALGFERKPAMILGLDLLKELRVVVDYGGKKLYLHRP